VSLTVSATHDVGAGFNLQAATRVAANAKQDRENLCKYILRPPLANDRLHILPSFFDVYLMGGPLTLRGWPWSPLSAWI